MKAKKLLLLSALAMPSAVFANEGAHIDGYYIPSSRFEDRNPNEPDEHIDGDGGGAKFFIPFGATQSFFLNGEYQTVSYDDPNVDLDQYRIGGGWQTPLLTGSLAFYGEYINLNFKQSGFSDYENDGFGIHARVAFPVAPAVQLYGQAGYVSVEDDENFGSAGAELLVGASVDFARNFGAFVDYRYTNLVNDDDSDYKNSLGDLRIGIRFLFDTAGGW